MKKFRVIDSDGHCVERDGQIAEYAEYMGRSLKDIDLSDKVKEKILLHNARRFYRVD